MTLHLWWVVARAFGQESTDSDATATASASTNPTPTASAPPPAAIDTSDVDAFLAAAPPPAPPPPPTSGNVFNPRLTAFGDVFASAWQDPDGQVLPTSGAWVRSAELDLRADVDPFAKAVAVLAIEQEPPMEVGFSDAFEVAPEEIYVDLVALPGGLAARAGRFKLPFGITNKMHAHDFPWPYAPEPFVAAMGEEGMADTGAMGSWRAPVGTGSITVEGALVSGSAFDPNLFRAAPQWLGRAELFDHWGQVDLGLGASSTGLGPDRVDGADLLLRWRKDSWRSVVLVAEGFRRTDLADPGFTATLQLQPTRPVYLGLRGDLQGDELGGGASLSYYTTEFLRLRMSSFLLGQELHHDLQLTFVWGAHPVEPYWVNR